MRITVERNTVNLWASITELGVNGIHGPYDEVVLADGPVRYFRVDPTGSQEPDVTGNGKPGMYYGGTPGITRLPNQQSVAVFNGSSNYLSFDSDPSMSINTKGNLTMEGWFQAYTSQFSNDRGLGYANFMGKCDQGSPTCEYKARMYSLSNPEHFLYNRLSGYVFNPTANLGSSADWDPEPGVIKTFTWYHFVVEYTLLSQPSDCPVNPNYPGSINIWINGIEWVQQAHNPTGCMSQRGYEAAPQANNSPFTIGRVASDTWFYGAIGDVALYNYLLTPTQISSHYTSMTGKQPVGTCSNPGGLCSF